MKMSLTFILTLGTLAAAQAAEPPVDFAKQIQPLLAESCHRCHGPEKQKGGLRLDDRDSALKGGDSGEPAVRPGNSAGSSLVDRIITGDKTIRMPPKSEPLSVEKVALLKRWVAEGATWPKDAGVKPTRPSEMTVTAADREFWAFQPLHKIAPPAVRGEECRTPVDRFIVAALTAKGLTLAPAADRRTLVRRLTFDLTGLPPTPAEIDAFVADESADAYEKLVDRLLASPHYGERWARHWLDVARYADSSGYEGDEDRPWAYPYRDFVVRAFNDDLPFSTFVQWQLAGDEIAPNNLLARSATGFLTSGPVVETKNGTPLEREKYRYDELDDMVTTTTAAFLGLTVGCCRCHDHKFDPLPTRDYYRLSAAFTTTRRTEIPAVPAPVAAEYQQREAEHQRQLAEARRTLKEWLDARRAEIAPGVKDEELVKRLDGEQRKAWEGLGKRIKAVEARKPAALPLALTLTDADKEPAKTYLLGRGEPANKKEEVELGFLTVLTGKPLDRWTSSRPSKVASTFRRTALAEWMTDLDSGAGPLLARVIVNRVWQHHFGVGLVRTPNDFGAQGERPTHPELLDWLADDLIAHDWSLKHLHRRIVTSAVYRQDTAHDRERAAKDADNRLLWYRRPTSLEAEAVRDAILSVSGGLDRGMGGPSIKPAVPPEVMAGRNKDTLPRPKDDGPEQWRRTVYLFTKRSLLTPQLEVLDAPNASASCGRRAQSTVATQALMFLNDGFVRRQAGLFAQRVAAEAGADLQARVRRAYSLALGRPPADVELEQAVAFLKRQADERKGLVNLCHVLFTLNEFMYVD